MASVLHASYSGYFPFCIGGAVGNFGPDNGQFGGGVYPVGMSLIDAMASFWKVDQWQISIGPYTALAQPLFYKTNEPIQTPQSISYEPELVCAKGFEISADGDNFSVGFVWSFQSDDPNPVINSPYSIKKKDNLYWPRFYFAGSDFTNTENIAAGATIDFFYNSGQIGESGKLNFNGYEIQLYKSVEGIPDADLNVSISPVGFRAF